MSASGWHRRRRAKPAGSAAGYGPAHRRAREAAARQLTTAGALPCSRCPALVTSDMPWHLDHCECSAGRPAPVGCSSCGWTGYRGVAHAACNISAGARTAARNRNAVAGYRSPRY